MLTKKNRAVFLGIGLTEQEIDELHLPESEPTPEEIRRSDELCDEIVKGAMREFDAKRMMALENFMKENIGQLRRLRGSSRLNFLRRWQYAILRKKLKSAVRELKLIRARLEH